ncbi:MAG: urea transporter [Planctomycetota bacterium]|nr:urea transporter [Planctomycetota bacterium]
MSLITLDYRSTFEKIFAPLFRACGEIILCSNSVSGFLFLIALGILAPQMAGLIVLGATVATITAALFREPNILIMRGYYGYNAALLGILWVFLWESTLLATLLFIPAAAGTALMVILHRRGNLWGRLRLPVLCLPTLLVVILLGGLAQGVEISTAIATPLERIPFEGGALLPALILFGSLLLAISIHSRRLALLGIFGAAFGTGIGNLIAPEAGIIPSLHLFTSASIAMALGFYFIRPGVASLCYAAVGILLTNFLWPQTVPYLVEAGIPGYSVPFFLVTLLFLYPIQKGLFHPAKTGLHPVYADIAVDPVYWKMIEIDSSRDALSWQKENIEKLAKGIAESGSGTIALTGAGISTDSGIPDIVHGYWGKYNPDDFTFKSFVEKTSSRQAYWAMSEELYTFIQNARPGAGHKALRDLEQLGCLGGIVTQNVDGLHQKASRGKARIIELHGTEHSVRCLDCKRESSREEISRRVRNDVKIPYCFSCRGILKTDATLDGEPVSIPLWKETCRTITEARLLLVVGTALRIPAISELVERAAKGGTKIAIISLGSTPSDHVAQYILRAPISEVLPQVVKRVRSLRKNIAPALPKDPISQGLPTPCDTSPLALR